MGQIKGRLEQSSGSRVYNVTVLCRCGGRRRARRFPSAEGKPIPFPVWGSRPLLFITAVPNTKLCVWGEEDSEGHVL